jgi:hypothetical protein
MANMRERCGTEMRTGVCGRVSGHGGGHGTREAINSATARYRKRHPERISSSQAVWYRKKARQVDDARMRLFAMQNGICPCGDPLGSDIVVDHNHNCCPTLAIDACGNCYRAAMHRICNSAIGMVDDCPDKLTRLAEYLRGSQ